jgi:hypothetical protein
MKFQNFIKVRDELLATANDLHSHILDRIDAYLELAQLFEKDDHQRAVFIRKARELIAQDFKN